MYKGRKKTWMSRFSLNLLISAFIFVLPMQANAYSVYGEVVAYTYGGDLIDRTTDGGAATALADSGSSQGDGGASAQSAYFADLSTGLLGTYISGDNPNAAEGPIASASAESRARFSDMLTLNIPAGTYASDLYISLNGFANGVISAFGCDGGGRCSNAYETYYFQIGGPLGGDVFNAFSDDTATYPDNSPNVIAENFTLSARISYAGTYLTDRTTYLSVAASLQGKGTALWLYPSTGDTSSSFVSDFYNTGGFSLLDVPDGVTWTSDSGVFLSNVPVVPEPVSSILFITGGVAFGIRSFLRKRKV